MRTRIEERKIKIRDQEYQYTLRRRPYARYMRLTMDYDGSLTVTVPATYPMFLIKKFLNSRWQWIVKNLHKVKSNPTLLAVKHSEAEINRYKKQTRRLVEQRIRYFNQHYGLEYNRIAVRNQKSRWGSCSSSRNLNFNYRLCLLPSEVADYIIVHEFCHLAEMNHSVKFWSLVKQTIPDYKERQQILKKI